MKRDYILIPIIVAGLTSAALITHAGETKWRVGSNFSSPSKGGIKGDDVHARLSPHPNPPPKEEEEFAGQPLYLNGQTMKRVTLAFNGVASDWYWIRSLQYVGRKIVAYEDAHEGQFELTDLSTLGLPLLPSLLKMSATLDPQFMEPYYYGAVVLPEIDTQEAISLLNQGIAANPQEWRLYQHLGYIYWQRRDYEKASQAYAAGSIIPGAPAWMAAMSARMTAEGGSRDAAREMYRHLFEASSDDAVKDMVTKQIMRLDSLDQLDIIRRALTAWAARSGRCVSTWRDVAAALQLVRLPLDPNTLAPLDPSGVPYDLAKGGCEVELAESSKVPKR